MEIQAWCWVTGERPQPWEMAALLAMDSRFINGEPQEPEQKSSLFHSLQKIAQQKKKGRVKR